MCALLIPLYSITRVLGAISVTALYARPRIPVLTVHCSIPSAATSAWLARSRIVTPASSTTSVGHAQVGCLLAPRATPV